mmetsp:Transcript_17491/g.70874  ORF Transcript_17491/g.70874 Transcript_17491/m.70874 type:complete len:97 (+) Transcript_17491:760-1050(+)
MPTPRLFSRALTISSPLGKKNVNDKAVKEIAEELLTTLNLPEKELILIPVNDAGAGPSQLNYNKAVGNHWQAYLAPRLLYISLFFNPRRFHCAGLS